MSRSRSHNVSVHHDAVRHVACPYCKAPARHMCENIRGYNPRGYTPGTAQHMHVARLHAYNVQQSQFRTAGV